MKRIRYISRFAQPLSEEDIDAIVRRSRENNTKQDITGMLVATGNLFYQILEGPDVAVDALYDRILNDARHDRVLLLDSESGDLDRLCPDWAMRKVDLSHASAARTAPARQLLRMVFLQRQLADEALQALEEYAWAELITAEIEAAGD